MKQPPQSAQVDERREMRFATPSFAKDKNKRSFVKIIIFNSINVVLIVALLYMINKIPELASKVKILRSEQVAAEETQSVGVIIAEVEKYSSDIESLRTAFVDETRFLGFISDMEQIKAQGVLREVSFPVTDPVVDSNKNVGLPVSIVLRGSIADINSTEQEIVALRYLLRTINANVEAQSDGSYIVRLGMFLYVDEEFSEN